jgi:hypothetical protein
MLNIKATEDRTGVNRSYLVASWLPNRFKTGPYIDWS